MDMKTLLFATAVSDLKINNTSVTNSQSSAEGQLVGNNKSAFNNKDTFSKALQVMSSTSEDVSSTSEDVSSTEMLEDNESLILQQMLFTAASIVSTNDDLQEVSEETELTNVKTEILVPEKKAEESVKALNEKANAITQELANLKQAISNSKSEKENFIDAKEVFGSKLVTMKAQSTSFKQDNSQNSEESAQVTDDLVDEILASISNKDAKKEQGSANFSDLKNTQTSQVSVNEKNPLVDKVVDSNSEQQSGSNSNVGLFSTVKESSIQKIDSPKQPIALSDTQEIVDNLVEQAKLTQKPGSSEMIIRLRPQHLGEMTVRIMTESSGAVTASFHSNNPEVRAIIQESLPAIRQELSNTGLKVNDVGVYAGLNEQNFGQQNKNQNQYDQVVEGTRKLSKEEQLLLEELQALHGENQSSAGGVDYRI